MKPINEATLLQKKEELENLIFGAEVAMNTIDKLLNEEPLTTIISPDMLSGLTPPSLKTPQVSKPKGEKTNYAPVQETIFKVLSGKKDLTPDQIVDTAKKNGVTLNRNSVNSTLSRLAKNGKVQKKGEVYHLMKSAQAA